MPIDLEASEKITREQTTALVAGIAAFVSEAYLCNPKKSLLICRDPDDNMILESAWPLTLNCSLRGTVYSWKFHGLLFASRASEDYE